MSRRSRWATARLIAALALIALVLPWSTGGTAGAQSGAGDQTGTGTGEIRVTRGVVMAETDAGPLTVDVYEPATAGTGRPAIVLVHGGAWFQGAPGDMDEQGRLLAEQGWVGFSVSYRLARLGQPTWPGNLTDVQRGVRWVAANAATYGADPARIALLGSSAGAHLSALVASVGTGLPGPDEPPLPVAPTTSSTSSTVPAGQVASASGAGGAPGVPGGASGAGGVPTTTPAPPQLVKAVALWSPPTELLDLVPDGDQPPASCGENPYCQVFWTVPFIPTMLGCGPAECRERYVEASLPTHVDGHTVPVWLANSEEELIPIGQLQSLTTALADARVDHQVTVLEGHEHANDLTAEVWNDMVPFLAQRLGVAAPAPITFPADRTGPDVGLIVAVIGVVVLLGVTVAAVIVLQRRGQPA